MAATTQYYAVGDALTGKVLYRWVRSEHGDLMQRWTPEGWISWPDLIRACGIGGDSCYEPITAEEAAVLRSEQTP